MTRPPIPSSALVSLSFWRPGQSGTMEIWRESSWGISSKQTDDDNLLNLLINKATALLQGVKVFLLRLREIRRAASCLNPSSWRYHTLEQCLVTWDSPATMVYGTENPTWYPKLVLVHSLPYEAFSFQPLVWFPLFEKLVIPRPQKRFKTKRRGRSLTFPCNCLPTSSKPFTFLCTTPHQSLAYFYTGTFNDVRDSLKRQSGQTLNRRLAGPRSQYRIHDTSPQIASLNRWSRFIISWYY